MKTQATIDKILHLTRQLSPQDKLKVIEQLTPDLKPAPGKVPLRSLRGMFKGVAVGNEDIKQIRREMWDGRPLITHNS